MDRMTNYRLASVCDGSFVSLDDKEEFIKFKLLADLAPKYEELYKRLAEYEDAEEQGLIVKLPCTIGSMVYAVTRGFISEYTICNIEVYKEGFFFNWRCEKGIYSNIRGFTNYDIGETVFLTKEEAEQALKQKGE